MKTTALLACIALLVGCSPSDDTNTVADSGPCPAGQIYASYWDQPGCDRPASHRCVVPGAGEDACLTTACGCGGGTITGGCGYLSEPFASFAPSGECKADDAATDAPSDATLDVSGD